jgi:hypothetical protein
MEEESKAIVAECEECDILGSEVERLTAELERVPEKPKSNGRPRPIKKLFEWFFGPLVYDGPRDCGHCKFWKPPRKLRDWYWDNDNHKKVWYDCKGDCKLIFGEKDTTKSDDCHRFTPRRRYMRRIMPWKSEA